MGGMLQSMERTLESMDSILDDLDLAERQPRCARQQSMECIVGNLGFVCAAGLAE